MRIFALILSLVLTSSVYAKDFILLAEDDWYPFSGVLDKTDPLKYNAEGMSIDIVTAAYEATGNTIKFVTVPFAKCLSETAKGNADGCFNSSPNAARERDFIFPKFSMFAAECNIYESVKLLPSGEIQVAVLRNGPLVSVTNEYEYGAAFDADLTVHRLIAQTDWESAKNVVEGKARYVLLYSATLPYIYKAHPELRDQLRKVGFVNQDENYIVFSRRSATAEESRKVFELGITIIRRNGVYHRILNKYRGAVK